MYEITSGRWRTPRGHVADMLYRRDTNDYNTIQSAIGEDEYGLAALHLEGHALDIGAHIGSVSIALALDNPGLQVTAVEAVPPNVELLEQNIERNGVSDRVSVIEGAAGDGSPVKVRWGVAGSDSALHHAFIGNAVLSAVASGGETATYLGSYALADLAQGPICFAKIDCEGCEYPFLQGPALAHIERIHGEEHGAALNLPGLDVTYTQDNTPRGFVAVRCG